MEAYAAVNGGMQDSYFSFWKKKSSKRKTFAQSIRFAYILYILPLPNFRQQKAVTHHVCNGFFIGTVTGGRVQTETGENAGNRSNLITKRRIRDGVYD